MVVRNFPPKCRNFVGGPRTEKKFVKWSASRKRLRTAGLEDRKYQKTPIVIRHEEQLDIERKNTITPFGDHPFMMSTRWGGVKLRWTHVDRGPGVKPLVNVHKVN